MKIGNLYLIHCCRVVLTAFPLCKILLKLKKLCWQKEVKDLIHTVYSWPRILSLQATLREEEGRFKPCEVACVNLLQLKTVLHFDWHVPQSLQLLFSADALLKTN